jgi:heme A synthase
MVLRSKRREERALLRWSYVTLGLAALQVALGLLMVYVSLEPAAQVAHLTIASLLLGAETVLSLSSTSNYA